MKSKGFFVYGVDDVLLALSNGMISEEQRSRSTLQSSSIASASKKQPDSSKKDSQKKRK